MEKRRKYEDILRENEKLRKSQDTYQKFIENSQLGIFKTNIKGEILFMNDAAANIYKLKSKPYI